jgi:hypothetical protein
MSRRVDSCLALLASLALVSLAVTPRSSGGSPALGAAPVLIRELPGLGFEDRAGEPWKLTASNGNVVLERAPELAEWRALVPGHPFRYWLNARHEAFAEGSIVDDDGTVVFELKVPQKVSGLDRVRSMSGGPKPCALLHGGQVICFADALTYSVQGTLNGARDPTS